MAFGRRKNKADGRRPLSYDDRDAGGYSSDGYGNGYDRYDDTDAYRPSRPSAYGYGDGEDDYDRRDGHRGYRDQAEYSGYGHDPQYDDRYDDRYDSRYDDRYDDQYDRRYDDRHDDQYGNRHDGQYDDRYDDQYDDRYDDQYGSHYDNQYDNRYDDHYDSQYGDQYDNRYDGHNGEQYDNRYGSRYDDQYDNRYDDRYDDRHDNRYDDGSYDRRYDDRYDDAYEDQSESSRPNRQADNSADDAEQDGRRDLRDIDEAFEEGNDDNSDLEVAEFGERYVDGPRKLQNLPQTDKVRAMAETFVDRFRNGGTVGRKTATRRIVRMQAVSESDIPTIKERLRKSNIPYNVLMVVFGLVVIGASGYLYNYFHSLSQNDLQMNAITAKYTRPMAQVPTDIETVSLNETDMPPIVDFEGLKGLNSEVSSWLRVPGTTIDYPVMTTPEQSKYLRLDIDGNYSIPGCLFTDWDNWNERMDLVNEKHIVIYGHHLPWPAMFHDMSLYLEEEGFVDSHRKMYYETPEKTYVLKVIGIHKATPEEYEARDVVFNDEQEFQEYVDKRLKLNEGVYDSGDYDRKTINKLFTFLTCTDSGAARCVVNAIVVEEYPTSYVPLVRAKMQGLIKADGTIDPDKEAQLQAKQEAEAQKAAEEQQQQDEQSSE